MRHTETLKWFPEHLQTFVSTGTYLNFSDSGASHSASRALPRTKRCEQVIEAGRNLLTHMMNVLRNPTCTSLLFEDARPNECLDHWMFSWCMLYCLNQIAFEGAILRPPTMRSPHFDGFLNQDVHLEPFRYSCFKLGTVHNAGGGQQQSLFTKSEKEQNLIKLLMEMAAFPTEPSHPYHCVLFNRQDTRPSASFGDGRNTLPTCSVVRYIQQECVPSILKHQCETIKHHHDAGWGTAHLIPDVHQRFSKEGQTHCVRGPMQQIIAHFIENINERQLMDFINRDEINIEKTTRYAESPIYQHRCFVENVTMFMQARAGTSCFE
jgi:hypothetical protein